MSQIRIYGKAVSVFRDPAAGPNIIENRTGSEGAVWTEASTQQYRPRNSPTTVGHHRASLKQVERTLVGAVILVILVFFVFLRDVRARSFPPSPSRSR